MKRLCLSLALVAVATLLVVVPVLAIYYVWISVVESDGIDYTQLAMNMTLDVTTLIDEGYIAANGTDTRITDPDYNVLPHMLADDRVLWVGDLAGNQTTQFIFWANQAALDSFPIITGHGGYVTINDTADLEPGDIYMFQFVAYLDMTATSGSLIYKEGAISFNRTGVGELTYAVSGGNSLVASSVTSGYCTLGVYSDSINMWIEINDVQKDITPASTVPDTANDWYLFQNDIAPYVYYFDEWIVTT